MKRTIIILLALLSLLELPGQNDTLIPTWTFTAAKGYAFLDGEVRPESGLGFGFSAAKVLQPFLSLGVYAGVGNMRGQDQASSTNWQDNPVWNGGRNALIDYNTLMDDEIYANFQTEYQEIGLQGIFTFTQLPAFNNNGPVDGFLQAGLGAMRYRARVDAAGREDALYFFSAIDEIGSTTKAEILADLSSILDGDYETTATDNAQITPLFQFGGGIQWRMNQHLSLGLGHRVSLSTTDELDSYLWDDNNAPDTQNDIQHFTYINLSYTLYTRKEMIVASPPPPPPPPPPPVEEEEVELEEPAPPPPPPPPPVEEEPEPPAVELDEVEEEIVRRAFENLEFEFGLAVIRESSKDELNELADLLLDRPEWRLTIEGHTDDVGESTDNMLLSQRRAESVRQYLIDRGLARDRFIVRWFGEDQPIATNDTVEGRQRNRRVEFEIVE